MPATNTAFFSGFVLSRHPGTAQKWRKGTLNHILNSKYEHVNPWSFFIWPQNVFYGVFCLVYGRKIRHLIQFADKLHMPPFYFVFPVFSNVGKLSKITQKVPMLITCGIFKAITPFAYFYNSFIIFHFLFTSLKCTTKSPFYRAVFVFALCI